MAGSATSQVATSGVDIADVLIIGSGASGGAVAWRLSEAGLKVVCLEQGTWVDPTKALTTAPDWEIRRQREVSPNPNVRCAPEDYPIADDSSPIKPLLFNGVGGSMVMWSSHSPRFHPSDFRVRSLDGVADDWPLTYEELEPYYDLNDRIMGMSGLSGDPANPPRSPRQMPPVPLGTGAEKLAAGFDRLGWHWWPSDININTRPYGDGRGACNHCGPCEMGCIHKAKASADVTYWPLALRNGAVLVTHARVYEITVDEQGRATGAAYFDREGRTRHQKARAVVLACNGIGTPRLLLLSKSKQHRHGLANSSGLVGKRFMLHPIAVVIGVFDELIEGWKGITACSILCQEFYETNPKHGFVRGFELQALRSHGPVISSLGGFGGPPLPWGSRHHARFDTLFGHTAALAVTSEDMPDEANRVVLDDTLKDGHGIPSPRMIYTVDDNARKILDFGIERAKEVFAAAGAKETIPVPLLTGAGFHLMGTARMGNDPKTSVADRWGRAHDCDNLFIVDGSLFVTAAAVNPTPTIQALALRTADHIISMRQSLDAPF